VQIFGGIGALSRDDWLRVNGFSNDFWGWGGEVFEFPKFFKEKNGSK
jgi:hypothetical protein